MVVAPGSGGFVGCMQQIYYGRMNGTYFDNVSNIVTQKILLTEFVVSVTLQHDFFNETESRRRF